MAYQKIGDSSLLKAIMVIFFSILKSLDTNAGVIDTTTVGVKWHPGHYFNPSLGVNKSAYSYMANVLYGEMETNPALVGMHLRFKWHELETAKDVYNFKIIDEHLQRLSTMGTKSKRLFILIETRTFDTTSQLIPCYMTTSTCAGYSTVYAGGVFPYKKTNNGSYSGNGIRFWKTSVRDRFVKLMDVLGKRYNPHSHFEGIGLGETSMGIPLDSVAATSADIDAYYTAHLHIQGKMRLAFPNTITVQFTNFPRNRLATFIPALRDMGAALGGPDILIDDPGLNAINIPNQEDGVYSYYPKLSGIVALTPSIMSSNYLKTSSDSSVPSRQPTIDELLDFGRDNLMATHLFWTRDKPLIYKTALERLKNLKLNNDPRVKLHSVCPTAYVNCITD